MKTWQESQDEDGSRRWTYKDYAAPYITYPRMNRASIWTPATRDYS
jgi:hypothetical protein